MHVLLIGSGGREHSIAWKLARSPMLSKLTCAPGNAGLAEIAACVPIKADDIEGIVGLAKREAVDFVVIGPEDPLALGLVDRLETENIPAFGPSAAAAQLEASKGFMKDLCRDYNIPTAAYGRFEEAEAALAFLETMRPPYVVKADGLAAGKGVVIAETLDAAREAVRHMAAGGFGAAGKALIIEEFLKGEEASFFVLSDGETVRPLIGAQDHKRAHDGDRGPNTGGMGAYSPAPILDAEMQARVMAEIVAPTIAAMKEKGAPFKGVLYAGLMIDESGPKLLEYNVRFGDPECQLIMRRMTSDLLPALIACARGGLADIEISWSGDAAAVVVMAAKGYPGAYEKGGVIRGLRAAASDPAVTVFHAGTARAQGEIVANGGRVLSVAATAPRLAGALDRAYRALEVVDWPGGFYRKDIGWRAL